MSGIPFLVLAVAAGYLFAVSVRVWDGWLYRKVTK